MRTIKYHFWVNLGQFIYRLRNKLKNLNYWADRQANRYWKEDEE
jgi:hypothetical protein